MIERTIGTHLASLIAPRYKAVMLLALLFGMGQTWADATDQAKRIHERITGVPPTPTTLIEMRDAITAGSPLSAALTATTQSEFYGVTLKNFATPWTNRAANVFAPLNDYTATVIGMVRDDIDFRQILSGDIIYTGSGPGVPAHANNSNAHYEALEDNAIDLQSALQRQTQSAVTGLPAGATAGVMTSRAAAQAFFIAGTNRAMFRFTLLNHMCMDLEQVLDVTRTPDRIRQDVSRSPGGDSRVFLNTCIGCHAGMDPLAQAFAYYDYEYDAIGDPDALAGSINYNAQGQTDPETGTRVEAKYFNNSQNFEPGFETPDDAWQNYWRNGQNEVVGWSSSLSGQGNGAKSMGEELSNSAAFAVCQVTKVFENVCLRPPQDAADHAQIDALTNSFTSNGHSLRRTFAESAVYCMGE